MGRENSDWSIQDVARLAHTTSRTLRHYDAVGLLPPSRIAGNGYRHYDERALVRLQRILLLRQLGLGLPAIAEVLASETDQAVALAAHLAWLQSEQQRLDRQIRAVESTLTNVTGGERLMAEKMFDGFDHTQYREEVEQRWGADAYSRGDSWWRGMSAAEKTEWKERSTSLGRDWQRAAAAGIDPLGAEAQALAERQFQWLRAIPETPGRGEAGPPKEYFTGLAEMYVDDERFAANYGGASGAAFVRDAMLAYAERTL